MKDLTVLKKKILMMPWYVDKYINAKLANGLSPSTILEYTRDFETFFRWILAEGLTLAKQIQNIEISDLESHTPDLINEKFILFLRTKSITGKKNQKGNSSVSIERKISSIRNFFMYLNGVLEDENQDRYVPTRRRIRFPWPLSQ